MEQACLKLSRLEALGITLEENQAIFWDLANEMNRLISEQKSVEWNFVKNVITFFDVDLINNFIDSIGGMETKNGQKKKLSPEQVQTVDRILDQLVLIQSACTPLFLIDPYTPEDVVAYLRGEKKEFSLVNIIRTIIAAKQGEKGGREIALATFEYFERTAESEEPATWSVEFVRFVLLDFLFSRFSRLTQWQNEFLVRFYTYKAVSLGIDVRQVFQNELRATQSVVSYVNRCKQIFYLLQKNEEVILVFDKQGVGSGKELTKIIEEFYLDTTKDKNQKSQQTYIASLYSEKAPQREARMASLLEVVDIYIALQDGALIDWLQDHNMSKEERYQYDLIKLIYSFGFSGEFTYIQEYYTKKNPLVPLNKLLKKLSEVVDLSEEKMIDVTTKFSAMLHEKKLLPSRFELIEFREQDGSFHWNEELLK